MAARVVCGSQPEAAVRSSSVAPSGRETASSRTPSLPPGRARCVSGRARCSGTASGVPAPACALSTPMASRPAGVRIRRRRSAASASGPAHFDRFVRTVIGASVIRPRARSAFRVRSSAAPLSLSVSGAGRTLRSGRAAAAASRTAWVSESFGTILSLRSGGGAECAARHWPKAREAGLSGSRRRRTVRRRHRQ